MEGLGPTHFDDYLEFKYPPARTGLPTGQTIPQPPTTTPPTPGLVRLYTRNDQLYAANQFGEMPLGGRVLLKEDVLKQTIIGILI
ncbi:MAG: hypothetical protein R3E39_26355 [Anaerolineae bacterium]